MDKTSLPSSKDIYIEIEGKRAAVVESYKIIASRNVKTVGALGQNGSVASVIGRPQYIIELSKVCSEGSRFYDGIDIYSLSDFSVVIVKPDKKIIFTGCEWDTLTETASVTDSVIEKLRLTALKRVCVK